MERSNDETRDLTADRDASAPSSDEVRRRAYELWVARGGADGSDMDDWLAAEREVRTRRTDMADAPPAAEESTSGTMSGASGTDSTTMSGMEGVIADEQRDAGGAGAGDAAGTADAAARTSPAPRTRAGRGRRAD